MADRNSVQRSAITAGLASSASNLAGFGERLIGVSVMKQFRSRLLPQR